jgi:polyphosphate kinase
VSDVKRRILINEVHGGDDEAKVLLRAIQQKVMALGEAFDNTYKELLIALARHNIFLLVNESQLSSPSSSGCGSSSGKGAAPHHPHPPQQGGQPGQVPERRAHLSRHRDEEERPGDPVRPVEVPTDDLPRFFQLPPEGTRRKKQIIILDNVIRFVWTRSSRASSTTTRLPPTRSS